MSRLALAYLTRIVTCSRVPISIGGEQARRSLAEINPSKCSKALRPPFELGYRLTKEDDMHPLDAGKYSGRYNLKPLILADVGGPAVCYRRIAAASRREKNPSGASGF